jgi:DNA-binding NtrC family response regulator
MHGHDPRPLAGYKFLVIEDEMMVAWRIGDMLAELGGTVGKIAFSYDQGWEALGTRWDCVIVDLNLNGKLAFPLLAALEQQRIPFIICSAYADALDVYPEIATATRVNKPVTPERLRDAVLFVVEPRMRDGGA